MCLAPNRPLRGVKTAACVLAAGWAWAVGLGQSASVHRPAEPEAAAHRARAARFLGGRALEGGGAAAAMARARAEHAGLAVAHANTSLSVAWQPLGPNQIASATYGSVTGRVSAVAIDPADATGNTVYVGTTGGGVWKSTNAAGPAGSVRFAPLTDALPVYSANASTAAVPSLSIGAIGIGDGVVVAGTGDANDGTDSYYGSGLLRSGDGGATWTLIAGSNDGASGRHSFVGLGVAGVAWGAAGSGVVVAALSDSLEGDLVGASDPANSVRGLYFSTDAGATWKMATVMDGSQTVQTPLPSGNNLGGNAATSVVWNPVRGRFYAAVRYHGYYESADGAAWTRLAQQPGAALTLTACPTNPGAVGSSGCPLFRGTLAVQAVTGDLFALTTDGNNADQGLWRDVCGLSGSSCAGPVSFGQQIGSGPLHAGGTGNTIPQADYNMALAAVAAGTGSGAADTVLLVGAGDLYRCSLGAGCTLRNTTNAANGCSAPAGVAGAQHAVAAMATAALPLVYVGNDGGLWRSTDGVNQQASPCSADDALHFQNLNGGLGSLAEVVSFAEHPADANTLLAGLGANGTAGTGSAAALGPWPQLAPGEGGTVAIDAANPRNWYVSTAAGVSIAGCANGAGCTAANVAGSLTIGLAQVSNDASLIDPPWLIDPALPAEVLIGTCRVWRGPVASPASWNPGNAISPLLAGAQNGACVGGTNSVVRSMAAGGPASGAAAAQNAGSTVLYAGMAGTLNGGGSAGGHLFATRAGGSANGSTAWTDLAASPVTNSTRGFNPGGFDVSSVAVDRHDATGRTVYATVMGFGVNHVYRSTDGGASWTNIGGNLPDAPANAVAVDPNDANTVYVALDTGVYATTQVASCASANCWSIYGTGLPNAPVVGLAASAGITVAGGTGALRAATYGRGIWQAPLLTASTSPNQAAMTVSPAALTFAAQAVSTVSGAQTVTVTNSGGAPLTVTSLVATTDFVETDNCTAAAVPVGGTCAVQVSFAPTGTGVRTGLLTIYGNVAGGQATVPLTGTGTPAPSIVLTPLRLSFPATSVGGTSAAQNITISNTGTTVATLQTPAISGDFRISANTCGTMLGPGSGCTVGIVFTPSASGTLTGALTVTDSAGTQTAFLSGGSVSPATDGLAPLSLAFGPQVVNTASVAQAVTLTNTGDAALTLIAGQITSGDFTVVNGCGNSLNGHASCALNVAFVPKNVGAGTGVLTVSDQYRSQTVVLSGTGLAGAGVSLAPAGPLAFAAQAVGTASAGQTVTLTNNGGSVLVIRAIAVTGDFAIVTGSNTCGVSVAVQASCTLQVAFAPVAGGARSGALTVTDNAGSSPQTLALSGVGVDFSLTAGNSSATVTSGQSAVYSLLIGSAAGVPGTVSFACSGLPAHAACLFVPATIALGGGTTLDRLTISTGVATASLRPGPGPGPGPGLPGLPVWLAWLVPVGLAAVGRRRPGTARLLRLAAVCGVLGLGGCGTARVIPIATNPTGGGGATPTPSGTSTIVVTATSTGLARTVSLTLTVQ